MSAASPYALVRGSAASPMEFPGTPVTNPGTPLTNPMTPTGIDAEVDQTEVSLVRGASGQVQTFTLRAGGVLRIGRGVANDIVLDFNGVSVYHAELFLRPDTSNSGRQLLCIRDDSKNGTGVRPGPHSPDAVVLRGKVPEWESLKKGAFRVLDHGWQMIVPLRSRKGEQQMSEAPRIVTVYVGSKIGPLLGPDEELDGEAWEPNVMAPPKAITVGG